MKLMFASDLHGSSHYCEEIYRLFNEEKADKLVLLGDILYHGPRNPFPNKYDTMKCFEILNKLKENIICVRGNCDSEVDQMVLEFPIMHDYSFIYLDNLQIFITHGHIYNKDNLPPVASKGTILIHGHTHINTIEELENIVYINPGSISLPRNEQENSYMIYENKKFTIKNLQKEEIRSIQF